jgi:small subunit ribosomal protein S1
VVKLTNYGAFVELEGGIDGLVHISQIREEPIEKIKDVIKIGDEVSARVIKIDKEDRRIGLSIKAASYSADALAKEVSAFESVNKNELTNLGDILDEASK